MLAAKYLGFALGPGSVMLAWSEPLAKCRRAAMCIRLEKLGLTRSVLLFNQRAASTLAFVAQLLSPTHTVVRRFHAITQMITAAPCHAIPARLLVQLRDVGSSVEIVDLRTLSLAARFRLARRSAEVQQIFDSVEAARQGDGLGIARRPQWHTAHVGVLSFAQVHSALADPRLYSILRSTEPQLQKKAMRLLRDGRPRGEVS